MLGHFAKTALRSINIMASRPSLLPSTTGGQDYADRCAHVIATSFADNPVTRYIMLSKYALPNTAVISDAQCYEHFISGIEGSVRQGAFIIEAGDFAGAALWFPPAIKRVTADPSTLPAPLVEYYEKFGKVKKKYLGDRKYWYLNLIGRHPERHEPGVARALIAPILERAKAEGVPSYLEAISEHARDVYAHFGYRVVEEVMIGEGKADKGGNHVPGGEGIVIYGMVAEPE